MRADTVRLLIGIAAANGVALLLMLLGMWLARRSPEAGTTYVMADFVLIPILMGVISSYFWREMRLHGKELVAASTLNLMVGYLLSVWVLQEGVVCLIMALPLVLLSLTVGNLIGRALFPGGDGPFQNSLDRYRISVVPLLITMTLADAASPHAYHGQETDTIVMRARPEMVWRYIIDYPAITKAPDYWLFRLGLPAPVQSTASAHRIGATRRCIFRGGVTFDEQITELEPGRRLTFDVITQPNYPEAMGHIVLQKGRFLLHDNGDGTTTVTGTSWYHLNVYPAAYYDLWVKDVVHHVHLQVMDHIRDLAEHAQ
jgi:uncharacterized protein YndB with AHSA1/START domain